MKRIYVASPLSPKLPATFTETRPLLVEQELRRIFEANLQHARNLCRRVVEAGYLPYAPHIFFTQFLDEFNPAHRALGLRLGLEELKRSDELWYWDEPSEGMKAEIALCHELGIKVIRWIGNAPHPVTR